MSPAAPAEANEISPGNVEQAPGQKSVVKEAVEKSAKETHDKAVAAGTPAEGASKPADAQPDVKKTVAAGTPKSSKWLKYSDLPKKPTLVTGGKAALTVAFIANPVATAIVAGGIKAHLWAWDKLKTHRPFSWIESGRQKVWNGAKDLTKSTWETATYLPKLAGTAVLNVAKGVTRGIGTASGWAWEKFTDIFEHTPGEKKHVFEQLWDKTTKWAGKIIEAPFKISGWYLKNAIEHPWRTLTGTALAAGIISYGPLTFSTEMVELIGKAMEAGIKYLGR